MNLATNARDAMPGGGRLVISTAIVELDREFARIHGYGRPGAFALLEVADTGVGMSLETQKRIFEPFFTTKELGTGTGLGLSIVYGIVKQHSGYITCCSEPGGGATFRVYIPLHEGEAELLQTRLPKPALRGGGETLLVAEDSVVARNLAKDLLQEYGYHVLEAEDGERAVEIFRERSAEIDLLILDIIMPKLNGKQVFDEISALKPGVRAIFTSGYAADIIHRKGLLQAGIHYLPKPVSPADLLIKVREVLDA